MSRIPQNEAPTNSAVGYVRVSTEEQAAEGVSLAAQRAKIEAYCLLHGLALGQTFADEGISGKRADNRPGLQEAIATVCGKRGGVLVVYSLSRLARSTRDAIDIAERIDHCGANLVSITEKIDTTTGMGRFFFTTIAALAQLERDQISERTSLALAYKQRQGQRVSHRIPYGFDLAGDQVHLVDNAIEQETMVFIAGLRKRGWSTRRIIRELDRQEIAPKGDGRWHPSVIMQLAQRAREVAT